MTNDPVVAELARANPEPHPRSDPADDQLLAAILDTPATQVRARGGVPPRARWRSPLGILAPALSLVVVAAVVIVFLSVRKSSPPASSSGTGVELVFRAEPTVQTPVVTHASLARTIEVMRQRAAAIGASGGSFHASGSDQITVRLPAGPNLPRAAKIFGADAQLKFCDWEANALSPSGKTVASQLGARDRQSLETSQGARAASPGQPSAGAMRLYDAVKMASRQPANPSPDNSRSDEQYYLFGAPKSAACKAAARAYGESLAPDAHCLVAGPDDSRQELAGGLPTGVTAAQGQELKIKRGMVVLEAISPDANHPTSIYDPNARFYVLKDLVALFGNDITNPRQSTDPSGSPEVTFSLTSAGRKQFEKVTATIADRGRLVSGPDQQLNQHFAVALDNQLLNVTSIDYHAYPNGVLGNTAAITGALTTQSARDLATQLRLGAFPVRLRLIDEQPLTIHR